MGSETRRRRADTGSLKVVLHSAISGRPLARPSSTTAARGKGRLLFSEEPRVFFLNVSAKDVEWKIAYRSE